MSFVLENLENEEKSNTCDVDACTRLLNYISFQETLLAREESYRKRAEEVSRDFSGLNEIFRYVELLPEEMAAEIARDSDDSSANAYGSAPGSLSISADLVLPGLNGLRVGELFWIDRIPAFYKAFGAFQIISIEDVVDNDGWKTKIHSRFNYLGKEWRSRVLDLFREKRDSDA